MNLHCLFLVKIVAIYGLLVCKTFGLKIGSCKFVDKSQVWGLVSLGGYSAFYGKLDLVAFAPGSQEFITSCLGHLVVAILLAAYSNDWEYGLVLKSCSHNQNKKTNQTYKKPV